jgi:hypothetical protein
MVRLWHFRTGVRAGGQELPGHAGQAGPVLAWVELCRQISQGGSTGSNPVGATQAAAGWALIICHWIVIDSGRQVAADAVSRRRGSGRGDGGASGCVNRSGGH